jgi:hypothetical protein
MIRRARTGNDVRPLTNGERRAIWAAKYYPLARNEQVIEEERLMSGGGGTMIGSVCTYCGKVSDSPVFDMLGRRYCCTQHRILGETEPMPAPSRRRDDDDEDIAAANNVLDFTSQVFGTPDTSFTGGGGESAGGGASGDY